MFVVALSRYATTLDAEVPALATDLGSTAYETRMIVAGGLPAIVLTTPDKTRALALLASLRSRGNEALAFDSSAVISNQDMIPLRQFQIEPDALVAEGPSPERLPFADILALIKASHDRQVTTNTEEKKRSFSAGRALLSGGLVMTKTTTSSSMSRTEDRQEVLYLYRRSGQTPFLLRETGTKYAGLGERMVATERANFLATIALLREKAPSAAYDERLVSKKLPEKLSQIAVQSMAGGNRIEASTDAGVDLFAHLLAMWLAKQASPPAR